MMTDKKQWSIKSIIGKLRKPGMVSTLVRGSGVVFISKGLGVGFGFFLQLLLARWMGASQYGFYVYILSWATLGAMIAGLGFGSGLLRFVPEYKTIQDESRLKGVLQGSLGISILASVAIALIATGVVLWHSTQNPIENLPAIILGIWVIPFLTINTLSMSMLRGIRKMTAAYIPSQVLRPAIILLGAFVVFSNQQNQSLDSAFVLAMTIVALVVVELFAGWQIHKHLPIGTSSIKATYELRSWLRVSFPLLMIGGFV
ncbi:MAG: oligosaccharide flippase family protein, partial [Leptolyngbyaceae bacterium]|nr:oligosaccharide flippase family protein [Leptolyngbyaceae bacterium]